MQIAKDRLKKDEEDRSKARSSSHIDDGPSDPAARKKWLEEQQIAADLALAAESLGFGASKKVIAADANIEGMDMNTLVDAISLTSVESFKTFGAKVASRVSEATGSKSTVSAMHFYKELIRVGSERLSIEDIKELETLLGVQRNKKLADSKDKKGVAKKPTSKAKPKAVVGHDDDYGFGDYDDLDVDSTPVETPAPASESGDVSSSSSSKNWKIVDDFM